MEELVRREVHLIDHYPNFLKEDKEFNAICDALDPEFNLFLERTLTTLHNIIPDTVDSRGATKYEEWLEILTNPYLPLEDRKAAILAKLNEMYPFTEIKLQKMLAAIVGWGHFTYKREGAYVHVEIDEEGVAGLQAVYELLQRLLPMNLHFDTILNHSTEHDVLLIGIVGEMREIIETPINKDIEIAQLYSPVGTIITEVVETY